MKKILTMTFAFLWATSASAQIFWTFDDNQNPVLIPEECEGRFDEVRGGVFNPTIDEALKLLFINLNSKIFAIILFETKINDFFVSFKCSYNFLNL